jgi:hypothetical protein
VNELVVIVKFNSSVCRQPAAFKVVNVYAPLAVYVTPFEAQVYEAGEVIVLEFVVLLFTVKFNVSVFKHPAAFNDVFVYEPPAVYVTPFADHVYESQEICDDEDAELLLIVKFNVSVFTQPAAFNDVYIYVPPAVYVTPLAAQV